MVFLDDNLLAKIQEVEGSHYKEILWVNNDIYGLGGWNRYFVNVVEYGELRFENCEPNEVVFSAYHSTQDGVQRAKNAGFKVFE